MFYCIFTPDCIPQPSQSQQPEPNPCVPPFITPGTHGCYYVTTTAVNFEGAKSLCNGQGGQVAEIESAEKNSELLNYIHDDPALRPALTTMSEGGYWIGATDQAVEGNWLWATSGRTLTETSLNHFYSWHLMAFGRRCAVFWQNGNSDWDPLACNATRGVICEIGENRSTHWYFS